MPDLTPADIDRLLELEAKASPNWEMGTVTDGAGNVLPDRCWITLGTQPDGEYHCEAEFTGHGAVANAEFIAAARNLVRPLAEQARRVPELEAEIARLVARLHRALGFMEGTALAIEISEEVQIKTVADNLRREAENIRFSRPAASLLDRAEKAEAALAAAREEIARLIENCRSEWDEVSELSKELAAAREENERLRDAAATYGDHHRSCARFSGYDCSCGWSRIRDTALAKEPQS